MLPECSVVQAVSRLVDELEWMYCNCPARLVEGEEGARVTSQKPHEIKQSLLRLAHAASSAFC